MLAKAIAVIGAGVSGIAVARGLVGIADVTVFEKSGVLGGRMAHRQVEPFAFDHGAQYFTARSHAFQEVVEDAIENDAAAIWPVEIASLFIKLTNRTEIVEPRYVGRPAMISLAKFLAKNIQVRRETEIKSLHRSAGGWHLVDLGGMTHGPFDLVISSAPGPQTAKLLPEAFSGHPAVSLAQMSGCFTLMVGYNTANALTFAAARVQHPVLSWISVDNSKPGRGQKSSLVIHSRNDWAQAYLQANRDWVKTTMLAALADVTGMDFTASQWIDLHRWRFANVEKAAGVPYLFDPENGLAACGDWCLGNRVEAAFESGRSLGQAVREWIATI